MSKTLSIRPEAFSKDMEYEKPEHPPPTTPTRSPAGTGFCWAIISFTLAIAVGVKVIGGFLVVSCGLTSGVVVVVAIGSPLPAHYNRRDFRAIDSEIEANQRVSCWARLPPVKAPATNARARRHW